MKEQPIHYWIPAWMKTVIKQRTCSKCNYAVSTKDVIAVGIREIRTKKSCLFAEHQCSKCNHRSITTFGREKIGSLQDLCFVLLESIRTIKKLEKAKKLTEKIQNDMSDKKIGEFLEFIRNVPTHDEFLKHIGCPTLGEADQNNKDNTKNEDTNS